MDSVDRAYVHAQLDAVFDDEALYTIAPDELERLPAPLAAALLRWCEWERRAKLAQAHQLLDRRLDELLAANEAMIERDIANATRH
jgi:hypothetical protein